jgi:hypothetical protein
MTFIFKRNNQLEETMEKRLFIIPVFFLILNFIGCQRPAANIPIADGEKLVRQLWTDFKSNDREVLEKWTAQGFQSVHEDGASVRDQEINLLMNLNLGEYTLDQFQTTQDGNVVVVTYTVATTETIAGKVLPKATAERLSVFMYDGKDWKWIAHANLNPMDK